MKKNEVFLIIILMKVKKLLFFFLFFLFLGFVTGEDALERFIIPICQATESGKNGNDHEVHSYSGFTLCYRESYEVSEWVSYTLTREKLVKVTGRANDFRPDPAITTGSADLADYKGSGYDRGHLAPSADMTYSIESNSDSFFMSNMTPQAPAFNRGMWLKLENMVRTYAELFGEVAVVTGPVLEKDAKEYPSIGHNHVTVPEYFYKVLLARGPSGDWAAIGFVLPNGKCEGDLSDYVVSVDSVEARCSLDFFSELDDDIEDKIESEIDNIFTSALKDKAN